MPFSVSQYRDLENVVSQYCDPSLCREYESLPENDRHDFLDAFQGALCGIGNNMVHQLCGGNISRGAVLSSEEKQRHKKLFRSLNMTGMAWDQTLVGGHIQYFQGAHFADQWAWAANAIFVLRWTGPNETCNRHARQTESIKIR